MIYGNKTYVPWKDYENVLRGVGGVTNSSIFRVNNLGCADSDYLGFPPGKISFVRYGDCAFATKLSFAIKWKASGVVIYRTTPGSLSSIMSDEIKLLKQEPIYTFPIFFVNL